MGRTEKLVLSIITAVVLTIAVGLEIAGSFTPVWTAPINDTRGNISFSLWTRQECWDVVCRTSYLRVKWTTHECVQQPNGDETCTTTTGYKLKPDTKCFVADYCNTTWNHNEEYDKVPSLLLVSKSFITPGIVSGVITILLYIVKIILQLRSPVKRLHLKAAYLTFAAVAGAAVEVGVIIFCAMLNKDIYKLGWAPALPGVGGFLQLCMAFGGYLGWRNVGDDEFDDLSPAEKMDLDREKKHFVPKWGRSVSANSNSSCNATSTKV